MKRVAGKVAIVTGSAAGLGAEIARRLVLEGAKVVGTDIQAEAGAKTAREFNYQFLSQDVTDEQQWASLVKEVEAQYGGLHILVNNAGIEGPFDLANPENTRLADWRAVQRVNVEGVFLGCRSAMPALRRAGGGVIINLSSTASLTGTPDFAAYGASKAAVRHLTKSVALHGARGNAKVRCNSIHPASVMTAMLARIAADKAKERGITPEQVLGEYRSLIPLGEFITAEDVANAVIFLASDEARYITGLAMLVDGGFSPTV